MLRIIRFCNLFGSTWDLMLLKLSGGKRDVNRDFELKKPSQQEIVMSVSKESLPKVKQTWVKYEDDGYELAASSRDVQLTAILEG